MGVTMKSVADGCGTLRAMRGPSWRWRVAEELSVGDCSGRCGPADALTRSAAEFLSLSNSTETAMQADAAKRFPKIGRAVALSVDDIRAGELKILSLGGCPCSEIAARFGVSKETVECFEKLFFDVRPMLSHTSWVYCSVIRSESEAGAHDLASKLRVAFSGGPELARRMLNAQIDIPADEADQIIGREMLLHAKLCAALDMPLSNEDAIAYVETYIDYQKHKEVLALEREKLALQYSAEEAVGRDPIPGTEI